MTYEEAELLVNKDQANYYLIVSFGYSTALILPYKDGLALLNSLSKAEMLASAFDENANILPIKRDVVRSTVLSQADYRDRKLATLLNVKVEDLKTLANPELTNAES